MYHANVNVNSIKNVIQINGGITINADVIVKNIIHTCEKGFIWNPSTCICEYISTLFSKYYE